MAESWDEDVTAAGIVVGPAEGRRGRACLTVLNGAASGQVFKVARGASLIGRSPNVAIRIHDEAASRNHAEIRNDGDSVFVTDLNSRNGTYINGERLVGTKQLAEGDKLQIGRTTILRFAHHDEIDDSFHQDLVSSALRDPLTKLYNKRYLMERLDSELKFARRHETAVSLLMMDIDHFKKVNDTHGHLAGDKVLERLAGVLVKAVRNEDVVARFGGEELAIVLRAIAVDAAAALAERLRRLIEQTLIEHGGQHLRATVSVGVAGYPVTNAETVEQLIEAADQALYRAKRAGRNRVVRVTDPPGADALPYQPRPPTDPPR